MNESRRRLLFLSFFFICFSVFPARFRYVERFRPTEVVLCLVRWKQQRSLDLRNKTFHAATVSSLVCCRHPARNSSQHLIFTKLRKGQFEMAAEKLDACLSVDSMKIMAESVGISQLGDSACARIADDTMFRLRQWIQVGVDFLSPKVAPASIFFVLLEGVEKVHDTWKETAFTRTRSGRRSFFTEC